MGFGFNDLKREVKAKPALKKHRGPIPITALNKLGCSVCPRDKFKLSTPKMEPQGEEVPSVYFLGPAPTTQEDERGEHWSGIAGRAVTRLLSRRIFDQARFGTIVQCGPENDKEPSLGHEVECCRGRVTADIERTRPSIVVGIGDETLNWATGFGPHQAMTWRGSLIPARFGTHVCWYYPLIYPNYAKDNRNRNRSEYELVMQHDVDELVNTLSRDLAPPAHFHDKGPYDTGIEMITGDGPNDMQRLEEALHWLIRCGAHGFDIETNGLRPAMMADPKILTAAAGTFERVIAFPVEHPEGWGTDQRIKKVKGMLGEYIAQSGRKRCHNLAFEMDWTAWHFGEHLLRQTDWDDTMAMGYAFDERQGTKALDAQTRLKFGFFLKDQSPVDVKQPEWWLKYPMRAILRYNGMDSKWTDLLAREREAELADDSRAQRIYDNKLRLVSTLVLTTARGMPIDFAYAEDLERDYQARLAQIEHRLRLLPEIRRYTSQFGTFDPTNSHHVLKLMKDVLHRPEVSVEDYKGNVKQTTGEEVLALMPKDEVPSAPLIVEHREIERNGSTYLRPLLRGELTGTDGKLHEDYNSMVAVSNRLSSRIHNWPKHKHKEVRGAVFAPPGYWIVACDYGQIEFRVAGMLSEDENIIKYSWTGYDVHAYWAQRMIDTWGGIKDVICEEFEIDWDRDGGFKVLRQAAKNGWVFPLIFGSTYDSCAQRMGIPKDIADKLGGEFWDEFNGVHRWQKRVIAGYEKNLYVETLGGWRRRGAITVNEAINHPIQGTAAEIMFEPFNALSERSQFEDNPDIHPMFNGHDDLSFRMRDERMEANIDIVTSEMCKPRFDYINVPLIVEVSVGARWHQLKEIAKVSSEHLYNLRNPYK